jgi:hypothetical protein
VYGIFRRDNVYIGEFSRRKFINVSVEPGTADRTTAVALDVAFGAPVLWIFGSGRYRASPVYLSVMPLENIEQLQPVRYFAGGAWSANENDAVPLFCAGDVGELSCRWNPFLSRWLLTFQSGNPGGVLMHSAPQPWGPWTAQPVMLFDPSTRSVPSDPSSGAGYGHFMHISYNDGVVCDYLQDNLQDDERNDGSFSFRDHVGGAVYGPYQITRYASGGQLLGQGGSAGNFSQIWFTMSTWNPYQSMLMTATITQDLL